MLDQHPDYVARAHKLGITVNVWTVDKEEEIRKFIDLGVDQIGKTVSLAERFVARL